MYCVFSFIKSSYLPSDALFSFYKWGNQDTEKKINLP